MGTFFSNCQVHSDSQEAVVAASVKILKEPAYVSPSVSGWVGVYPEGQRTGSDKIAKSLSKQLSCGVFTWNVHDDDIFWYSLYENGKLRDEFNSSPDYFNPVAKAKAARLRGKPEVLVPFCLPGVAYSQVQEVLHPPSRAESELAAEASAPPPHDIKAITKWLAEQQKIRDYQTASGQAGGLAKLLGIAEDLQSCEYRDVAEANGIFAGRQFRLVGSENLPQEYKDRKIMMAAELAWHPEKMQVWLQKGANANAHDSAEVPVLFQWAKSCLPAQVELLLKAGADVNATTDGQIGFGHGMTALMAAVGGSYEQPDRVTDTVKLLIAAGADVNARSESGRTAFSEAVAMTDWQNHRLKIGRRAPEDVLRKLAGWSAQVVEMLRAAGATE